jgi:hypothetical protein
VLAASSAQAGRYVVEYDATSADNQTVSTNVIVNVLPAPSDIVMPSCAAFSAAMGTSSVPFGVASTGPQLTPDNLAPITQSFLDRKRASPNEVEWTIGNAIGAMMPRSAGVQFTLSKWHAALLPGQAVFYFTNHSAWDMQIVAIRTTQPIPCTPTVTLTVNQGESASLLADTSMLSTLLFRRDDGKSGWENLSVLNQGPFWTLFGGKEVDVDLIGR